MSRAGHPPGQALTTGPLQSAQLSPALQQPGGRGQSHVPGRLVDLEDEPIALTDDLPAPGPFGPALEVRERRVLGKQQCRTGERFVRRAGVVASLRACLKAPTAGALSVDGERVGDMVALGPAGVARLVAERLAVSPD